MLRLRRPSQPTPAGARQLAGPIPRFIDTSHWRQQDHCHDQYLPDQPAVPVRDQPSPASHRSRDLEYQHRSVRDRRSGGPCTLNWYGNNNGGTTNTPITASTTATTGAPVINAGTTWTGDASATNMAGQGFTGYMIRPVQLPVCSRLRGGNRHRFSRPVDLLSGAGLERRSWRPRQRRQGNPDSLRRK